MIWFGVVESTFFFFLFFYLTLANCVLLLTLFIYSFWLHSQLGEKCITFFPISYIYIESSYICVPALLEQELLLPLVVPWVFVPYIRLVLLATVIVFIFCSPWN